MELGRTDDLERLARHLRREIVRTIRRSKASHIGTALSIVELLTVLYGRILRVDPARLDDPDRDRFVLSKGHGCAALYVVLAHRGFFPREWLDEFYQNGSPLAGHATHNVPGVEVSTGSLGHGLPIAAGMAIAGQRGRRPYRVFALLSDGECDEGSTWEAVLFAGHHRLGNLTAIVDYNKIQGIDRTAAILDLEPFADKWRSFGWFTEEIDGHDVEQIERALRDPSPAERPKCLIAHTVKGKGVSFMEDSVLWHYRCPDDDEYGRAMAELES
jgi:transketolase